MKPEESKEYQEKYEKIFVDIRKMENDPSIPGQIKYFIVNLIHKKNKNFEESKFEQSLKAKSKKELINSIKKESSYEEKEEKINDKEKEKEEMIEKIKNDLREYQEYVDEKGSSKDYHWKTTTELYDLQYKSFDDILEAYLINSADFIGKKDNIKHSQNYIKELISFYNNQISQNEENDLKAKIISLFENVKDLTLDTPLLYDIYSYVLFTFIYNNIMEIEDLEKIFNKENIKEDIIILSKILQKISELFKDDIFKKELRKFDLICKNKGLFKWLFGDN